MRVRYRWSEQEWQEAVRLAQRPAVRPPGLPGMTYALVAIPLLGAIVDLRSTLRENRGLTLSGSIVPLLLLLVAIAAGVFLTVAAVQRRRRTASAQSMPPGECELMVQENGWRCGNAMGASREDRQGSALEQPGMVAIHQTALASAPLRGISTLDRWDATPANASPSALLMLRPWTDLVEGRQGNRVLVFVLRDGFEAVPTRSLTPEQGGHLHRMMARKLRPTS